MDDEKPAAGNLVSTLLNVTDGLLSTEGRVLIYTTNHINKIDPTIIRPGRIDYRLHVDYVNRDQAYRMFCVFYENSLLGNEFADKVMEHKCTPARLQNHFLEYRNKPEEAISMVKNICV